MPLNPVRRFLPTKSFGFNVRRVRVFGAHRISDQQTGKLVFFTVLRSLSANAAKTFSDVPSSCQRRALRINSLPVGKIRRQIAPLTPVFQLIENRIDNVVS